MQISALNRRRWRNFRANKRAYWSLVIFSICFFISLLAELIANDKPILVKYRGEYFFLLQTSTLKRLLEEISKRRQFTEILKFSVSLYQGGWRIVLNHQKKLWRQSQMHLLI